MARYTGPVCKLCRREGMKLFLKAEKCLTPKCPVVRRAYPPGQHGLRRGRRPTEFGVQLREKQRARRIYGVLERQFRKHFEEAERRPGVTGEILLQILESRFDNVIYRLGIGGSRAQARQLVRHGHFLVNGRPLNVPSALLGPGQIIDVKPNHKARPVFMQLQEQGLAREVPAWLSLDLPALTARVLALPTRSEIDTNVSEQMIVEHYSR